jgi:hypothetical protein
VFGILFKLLRICYFFKWQKNFIIFKVGSNNNQICIRIVAFFSLVLNRNSATNN